MRYRVVVSTPSKKAAETIWKLINESKIYNGKEIINLKPVQEVCDFCAKELC